MMLPLAVALSRAHQLQAASGSSCARYYALQALCMLISTIGLARRMRAFHFTFPQERKPDHYAKTI